MTLTLASLRSPSLFPFQRAASAMLLLLSLIILHAGGAGLAGARQQDEKETTVLIPGQPIERQLAGEAAHLYQLQLAANQFLHLVVEQKGIDVAVKLFAPDGKQLVEVDSPNGAMGPEPVMLVTEAAGSYRLEVRSLEATAEAGRYEVEIKALRAATAQDKSSVAAQQAYAEAALLESEGSADSRRKAIAKYTEALPLWRAANDRAREATTLYNIGSLHDDLGEKQKALELYEQAIKIQRAIGDRNGEANTINNTGLVFKDIGEKQKALEHFQQALGMFRALENKKDQASALNNIGAVYDDLGDRRKALDFYDQALPLWRAAGDRRSEAITLNNIGAIYGFLGEMRKALEYLELSLPLRRATGDRGGEANTLNSLGFISSELGEKQKALEYYQPALPLWRVVGNRYGEAVTLNNLANIYEFFGEITKARDLYEQSLVLHRAVKNRGSEARTLGNLGKIYFDLGDRQKGIEYLNLALVAHREVGNRDGEAIILHNIGGMYRVLGEKQKALDFYQQALPLMRAVGNRKVEAEALNNIGATYREIGQPQKALEFFEQALPIRRAISDRSGEALTLYSLALFERSRHNLAAARARIEEALVIIESLRTKIASRDFRSSYFATVKEYYDFYIDILMQQHKQEPSAGHDKAALEASERGRARSLLETLIEAGADIRQGVDPQLVARERELQQRLNTKAQIQMRLLGGKHTPEQAQAIAKEIEELATDYRQVQTEIRQKSPNYAALTQPQPLSLKEIQAQVLDPDTLLLEYSLGEERSYLWAITSDSMTGYELPSRVEIETLARSVYALLVDARQWQAGAGQRILTMEEEARGAGSLADAERLSRLLLAPVAARLKGKRLIIVADGALQYLPFAALPSPSNNLKANQEKKSKSYRPLILEHEIVSLPSASTLALLREQVKGRTPAPRTLAVLADPVFESTDERVEKSAGQKSGPTSEDAAPARELPPGLERSAKESGFTDGLRIPRLPGTRAEANQILALAPQGQSHKAFDFEADRESVMNEELAQYRYVHFATHGFLNSTHPELSGLVLSMVDEKGEARDGFLRAHEVFNLKLPAELVVLSACQTGLGKEVKGEGLVGLTRGFMYAGSPRVVVSLWSVSDEATAELMTRFYRGMLKDGLRPAAALRAAQVSLRKEKRWASPYYWAAFTLQGEWK